MFLRLDPSHVSIAAEAIATRLHWLDETTFAALTAEVLNHPNRWRLAVRRIVQTANHQARLRAARLLDEIGEIADVRLLRAMGKKLPSGSEGSSLGQRLIRRLANRIWIE